MSEKIKLQSSDSDEVFEVDLDVAKKSITIKTMLEDLHNENDEVIPLPNVTKKILTKVIQWAEHHKDDPEPEPEDYAEGVKEEHIPEWDRDFLKPLEEETLFDLILAANYLDIKGLMESACKTVALMIRGKTAEEIRQRFNIENDIKPEDEIAGSSSEPPAIAGPSEKFSKKV